jgi:hypothetical protein
MPIISRPRTQIDSRYAMLEAPLADNQPHARMPSPWCYIFAMSCVCDLTTLLLHIYDPVESDLVF